MWGVHDQGHVPLRDQLDGGGLAVRTRAVEVLADDGRVHAVAPEHVGGALRREDLEAYIKRIRTLEEMATAFKGVSQAYAIQAGREVRIIVKPEEIDDLEATRLARDLAKKIEETMQYPGQIRVTVIRETRAVDYAK